MSMETIRSALDTYHGTGFACATAYRLTPERAAAFAAAGLIQFPEVRESRSDRSSAADGAAAGVGHTTQQPGS